MEKIEKTVSRISEPIERILGKIERASEQALRVLNNIVK